MAFPQVGAPFSTQTLQGTLTVDQDPNFTGYQVATNTTSFTLTAAQITPAQESTVRLTGTLTGAANVQLPTAASIIQLIPTSAINAFVGYTYQFKLINSSSGAFTWTVTTNTGITLNPTSTGSVTIAQNAQRVFAVTVTGQNTVSVQDVSP